MAPPKIQIDPEVLARARALYENGTSLGTRFQEICDVEGEESLLRRMRHAPQLMPLAQLVIGERSR